MKQTDDMALILVPIAQDAASSYLRKLPLTQPKAGDGSMSLELGLPPECATPVAAGGKYPMLKDQNGAWNLLSRALQAIQSRYSGAYSADLSAKIGGYPLNAIVSAGTPGAFWVSTADDNTTAPGAKGAAWQSLFDGYATQTWSSSLFSTIAALSAETQRATTIESNLQSGKYDKTGGILTGTVTAEGNTGGFITQYNPGSPSSGSFINYPGFTSRAEGRGGQVVYGFQEQVGSTFRAIIASQFGDGSWRYVKWGLHERINDSQFGDVAYTSDLANYQPKGSYVPTSTYASDFSTSDSRVINLPYGHKIQKFTFQGTPNAGQLWVPFPTAFSDVPVVMVSINNETIGVFSQRYVCIKNTADGQNAPNITSSGFLSYSAWGNSSGTFATTAPVTLQVTAIGSK